MQRIHKRVILYKNFEERVDRATFDFVIITDISDEILFKLIPN
jgi:hypothetical protein